jgi:hypothetical protein
LAKGKPNEDQQQQAATDPKKFNGSKSWEIPG